MLKQVTDRTKPKCSHTLLLPVAITSASELLTTHRAMLESTGTRLGPGSENSPEDGGKLSSRPGHLQWKVCSIDTDPTHPGHRPLPSGER